MSYLTPVWPTPQNVKSLITTKNTLLFSKGDGWKKELAETLSLPNDPIWLKQTHSNQVVEAIPENTGTSADASIAFNKNNIAAVLTADCLPVLLCTPKGDKVAAIHAGWRGLVCGIIPNCVKLMNESPDNLLVYLGPAIGPFQFEVGEDVYEAFLTQQIDNQRAFTKKSPGKWLANIYTLASIQLNRLGIHASKIFGGNYCTFTETELFYSYRRNPANPGRMVSLIWFE